MSLISRRTLGWPDPSRRLSPGQEQLLMLASALGSRLRFRVPDLSDKLMAENIGSLMMRGLAAMQQVPFTGEEELEFRRLVAGVGPDRPGASVPQEVRAQAEARVSIYLQVTPAGEQYLLKPPAGRPRFGWWHRLTPQSKARLMVVGAASVIGLVANWLKRFF